MLHTEERKTNLTLTLTFGKHHYTIGSPQCSENTNWLPKKFPLCTILHEKFIETKWLPNYMYHKQILGDTFKISWLNTWTIE